MRIGIDVGGTFTDVVAIDPAQTVTFVKAPSTPHDPSRGVLNGLELLAGRLGKDLGELLQQTKLLIHGTTVATNIVIEKKGAKIGLITTGGFGDLLELRDGTKAGRYRLRIPPPDPVIPRPRRLEVRERVRFDGQIEAPLDQAELAQAVDKLRSHDVEAVVVCFLHAHRYPQHELQVRDYIQKIGWDVYLCLSHEILSREGEYERLSTTTASAYVGPALAAYLKRLERGIEEGGGSSPIMIMQSNGGVLPVDNAYRRAVGAITSGPAGGAMAGALFARSKEFARVITYDMGGTSTDVCLIEGGVPLERQRTEFANMHIAAPAIDIVALGAGGGSIARIDSGGILELGPESAGADPGPACYNRGGTRPTVADASVALGFISPTTFLGGKIKLSREAAVDAVMAHVGNPLGLTAEDAAQAIHQLATTKITEGIRASTVRRGMDPREYALISFGGAGGVHADAVARELRVSQVVIPRQASVLSALGFLAADVRHDLIQSVGLSLESAGVAPLRTAFAELEALGREQLATEGFTKENVVLSYILDCRYESQVHTIPTVVPASDLTLKDDALAARIRTIFEGQYQQLYRHHHTDQACYIETCRLVAFGSLPRLSLPRLNRSASSDPTPARTGERAVYLDKRTISVPTYWFDDLLPGMAVGGPALVDSSSTTVVILQGSRAIVDESGSLCIGDVAGDKL